MLVHRDHDKVSRKANSHIDSYYQILHTLRSDTNEEILGFPKTISELSRMPGEIETK